MGVLCVSNKLTTRYMSYRLDLGYDTNYTYVDDVNKPPSALL